MFRQILKLYSAQLTDRSTEGIVTDKLISSSNIYFESNISNVYFDKLKNILTKKYIFINIYKQTKNPWPEYASEIYRPSDRRLSAKLVQTFADRECHVVTPADPT
jgi:hypothetical protein